MLLTVSTSFSKSIENSLLNSSVLMHPDVIEKANEIILKGINVDQILADDGLKINFSTQSKLPLTFKGLSGSKLDDALDTYVNGVVTVQKNIFDFGVVDYRVEAENSRKKALVLEYQSTYEQVVRKLLNAVNNIERIDHLLSQLKEAINVTKISVAEVKLRFTSGVGTVMDVRKAQLLTLDLKTEYQSLNQERLINLLMLKDEFSIDKSQTSNIQAQVDSFVKSLNKQQQAINDVVNNTVTYLRSSEIINLEKTALRKDLKSIKAQDFPQLKASLTSVIYEVQNGFDEYEVYGGVDLTMPIFDSGLSSVKKRSINYKIKMQDDLMLALTKNKSKELNELVKQYQKIQVDHDSAQKKVANLREKLKQIKQKLAVVEQGLLSKLQTQLQLSKIERSLASYPYSINTINIDYWALNEQLLDKMKIQIK